MNSRQRVQQALNHEQPDRCPVFASFVPEVVEKLRAAGAITEPDIGVFLGNDMVKDCVGMELSFYGAPFPEYTDAWGIKWRYQENEFGTYTEIVDHPLSGDLSKVDSFRVPDPSEDSQYDNFRAMKERYGEEKWIIGSSQISIFEAAWYLRGLDQFFMDMALEPDYVEKLLDKVMQFSLGASRKYIELGADMVWFGDDISMQTGMMMSMDMWRKFLKPRYAVLFSEAKKANPNIKIAYHSCGNCQAILEDMIEIGLDVLNPIQPTAIDPVMVKKRYGDRLSLFGGMCVQKIMPFGTPQQIQREVERLKDECGKGGGYILAPAHHIQADTPVDNIMAFYNAAL
ncbi:MAG: hypothetical protein J7M40_18950 [Planctomycetes bacterium]|nr:hypothetical protein [Planctomycetota bacterium]